MRLAAWLLAPVLLPAATFDSAVKPILAARCLTCHGAKVRSGGLSLESREDILRGGKSGAAILAGRPVDSLLMSMVSTGKMPMGGAKLADSEIGAIREWIEREDARPPVAERDVLAILSAKCWVCHGRREKKAGLDLRTRASMLRGGKSGAAIAAGQPDQSLLVKRISAQQMPPPKLQEQFSVRGLTDDELAKVKRWIEEGAQPDNEQPIEVSAADDPAIRPKDREFWAFQPPKRPAARGIDELVIEKSGKLAPVAPPLVLLRRAFFDLTGLPPTPEQIREYERDTDPKRYEKLIDRLLESPRYGERMGRHWLDAVGYADSEGGNNSDAPRRHAWRYRDYVIRAFNANVPFDRFLAEQVAGDELFDYTSASNLGQREIDLMAATGFWRMAPDGTNSTEQNFIPERMDVIAGQIEVFGSAVLGMSVGCARCHDHKYDPLPTRDYYRLVSILTPSFDPYAWLPGVFPCGGVGAKCDENNTRYFVPKGMAEFGEVKKANAPFEARVQDLEAEIERTEKSKRAPLQENLRAERGKLKPLPLVRALFELGPEPPPTRVLLRGDPTTPGALVTPGAPSILSAGGREYRVEPLAHSSGRRLALAKWLTQPDHPTVARVMVNRVWMHHFGEGIVTTPGNFGRMGSAPSNQKLLDWLATEFVRTGWDIKALHRTIMTSATYRQRSGDEGTALRRIDAEAMRDTILAIAGRLDTKEFGEADPVKVQPDGEVVTASLRRSIYVTQRRTQPVSVLDAFDQPFMNPNCVKRGHSVVSSQALHLMNSDLLRENSRYMAGRIIDDAGDDAAARIERAYLLTFARKPTAGEVDAAKSAIERMTPEWKAQLEKMPPAEPVKPRAQWLALATLCHTLMNSAEFLYID